MQSINKKRICTGGTKYLLGLSRLRFEEFSTYNTLFACPTNDVSLAAIG